MVYVVFSRRLGRGGARGGAVLHNNSIRYGSDGGASGVGVAVRSGRWVVAMIVDRVVVVVDRVAVVVLQRGNGVQLERFVLDFG